MSLYIITRRTNETFKGIITDEAKRELVYKTFFSNDGFEGGTTGHFEYYFYYKIKAIKEEINVRSLYHHRKTVLEHIYSPNKNVTVFISKNKSKTKPEYYIFREAALYHLPKYIALILLLTLALEALYYRFI